MDLLTLEACAVARRVLPLIPETEPRPGLALAAAEAWASSTGAPSPEALADLDKVRDGAWEAARDLSKAGLTAAASAAFAAWHAAWSARDPESIAAARVHAHRAELLVQGLPAPCSCSACQECFAQILSRWGIAL